MEEATGDSPENTERLQGKLSKLQKDVYQFLLNNKPQKALAIAKATRKTCARDVNPDLYKMQSLSLLDCNEDKLWCVKAENRASENTANRAHPNRTTQTTPTVTSQLTFQQTEICTFLEKKGPLKAVDIARGVGKTKAKDVNPELYRLRNMDRLTYSEQGKLWMVKRQNDPRCNEGNEESEEPGRSFVPADNNPADDATSVNQTQIETQSNQVCNGSANECKSDTGMAPPDCTVVGGQCMSPPWTAGSIAQTDSNMAAPVMVQKYYYLNIYGSQNFSVGDGVMKLLGQDLGNAIGDCSTIPVDDRGMEEVQYQDSPNSTQTEDGSMDGSHLSAAEETQEWTEHTSSPTNPDQSRQCLQTPDICDGVEQLNLEHWDSSLSQISLSKEKTDWS